MMEPENLKLLLHSYIQCKQSQDECDGVRNKAECDDPYLYHLQAAEVGLSIDEIMHSLPSGHAQAPFVANNTVQVARHLNQLALEFSSSQPDKSIIKFKEICMVTNPVEQTISIPVIRDPLYSERVTKVSWNTRNKTALSGIHYVESCGDMTFIENETSKDIKIKILNSNDDAEDLRFTVELKHDGLYDARPMTISLEKISSFYPDERTVLNNLPCSLPISISDIKSALSDKLNARTFHMALTHLCSTNDKVDIQMALALELSSWCLRKMRDDTVLRVLSSFFRKDNYSF